MPPPPSKPVAPRYIALACLLVVATLFFGSILLGVAYINSEPAPAPNQSQP